MRSDDRRNLHIMKKQNVSFSNVVVVIVVLMLLRKLVFLILLGVQYAQSNAIFMHI